MRHIRLTQLCAILTLTLISSGCGLFSKDQPLEPDNKRIASSTRHGQIMSLNRWRVNGAISITANNKTDMGSFSWSQNQQVFDFQTFGPLNMAGIRIWGRPGHVTLQKNAKHRMEARSVEQLMQRELGWSLPLGNIAYWGRGVAAPGVQARATYDRFGHLKTLNQQGWQIHYLRYQGVKGMDLPRTVLIRHNSLRVKIAFKRWRV